MMLRSWRNGLLHDARHALRTLRRSPGYTLTAVVILALGIAVNVAVCTIAYSVLFRGYPHVERSDRLLFVTSFDRFGASYPDFLDWREQAKSFDDMALVHGTSRTLDDGEGYPETYFTTEVTANTFALVGEKPMLGRDFAPYDERPGADPVAILSYEFWARRYGKDPAVIGRRVRLNGAVATIVGVMPPGFLFPQNQALWVAKRRTPEVMQRGYRDNWFVVGRLTDDATVAAARAELETIGRRLEAAYPDTNRSVPIVHTFREMFIGDRATMIYAAMFGAVTFVLLIACANLANLLLARALTRSRELAVRVALGAGRARIVRQLLLESLLLAALGGLAGAALAAAAVHVFALFAHGPGITDAIGGDWFDGLTSYAIDGRILIYIVALCLATGVLFGLAPAARLARLDVNSGLKEGARGATGARATPLSSGLLVAETALAIVLLAGAGVMGRSFLNIYDADTGVDLKRVNAALFDLRARRYADADRREAFFDALEGRLVAAPEIAATTLASNLPTQQVAPVGFEIEGEAPVPSDGLARDHPRADRRQAVGALTVARSYFRTLGAGLLQGRDFDSRDGPSGTPIAIVNARFAAEHWPGESALGKRFRLFEGDSPGEWLTVVGVAPNIAQSDSTRQAKDPLVYLPYSQRRRADMWVVARSRTTSDVIAGVLQREVRALDPALPALFMSRSGLEDYLASAYEYRATSGALFLGCAAIALLLAAFGLYAVVSYAVTQSRRDIGLRIAIGASERDVLALVLRLGLPPLGVGMLVGLGAALAVNRLLASLLVGVSPADPATLALTSAALTAAGAAGCWLPARRATRVDPVATLRQE